MTDTNVKIRAKGCANTGVTDELATKLYSNKGGRIMAIVELKVDETHEKADGDRKVDLVITELEPVVDGALNGRLDEHVRTIQAALFRNRALLENGGDTLPFEEGGVEPTVEGVMAAGQSLLERDEDGEVTGLWNGTYSDVTLVEEEETEDGPHEYVPGPDDSCLHCGQAEHDDYDVDDEAADVEAEQDLVAEEWVDSQHGDEPEEPDDEAGQDRPATNPFTVVNP